jgi:hypothetical protein
MTILADMQRRHWQYCAVCGRRMCCELCQFAARVECDVQVTVLDWDPEKGLAGTMSMLGGCAPPLQKQMIAVFRLETLNRSPRSSCSLGKKLVHSKEQAAAAEHLGSGAGKNDEPIGYCFLSLNEMVRGA